MRNFLIGLALMIFGVLLIFILKMMGISHLPATGIGLLVIVIGFGLQMYDAFSPKFAFEREQREIKQKDEALREEIKTLPPEEAIRKLMDSVKQTN